MSTLTDLKGCVAVQQDVYTPDGSANALQTTLLMDASGEKVAFYGEVWHPTTKTGTINIRKVHFRLGAVTFNVASTFRVSLQNVSMTAGPPYQPDGTQDQTADMTSLTANGWNTTGNLSADRAVDLSADSPGDANSRWLCVVFEYQTFTAADSIIVSSVNNVFGGVSFSGMGGGSLLNTGSWALQGACQPILVLECDDGSFAFLRNGYPYLTPNSSASVSSSAAIRRAGVKFRVPVEMKISMMSLQMQIPNGCDGTLTLYDSDGSTVLRSIDVDNDAVSSAGINRQFQVDFEPVTLAANTYYRFVFVGTTTTSATVYYAVVNAAGHMDGLILGQDAHWTEYDGASWTDTTTQRPYFGIGICAVHNGAGGGGGLKLAGRGGLAG